jgi:hypothetical protein
MTDLPQTSSEIPKSATLVSRLVLGILVLILLLVAAIGGLWLNRSSSATETEDAERSALRTKNLAELQAADQAILDSYGWNDQAKGVVHLPITKAMEQILPALNSRNASSSAASTKATKP